MGGHAKNPKTQLSNTWMFHKIIYFCEYNFCKFALLAPPSTIEMHHRITAVNETKMHHLETLTGLTKDSFLKVSKIIYKSCVEVSVSLIY